MAWRNTVENRQEWRQLIYNTFGKVNETRIDDYERKRESRVTKTMNNNYNISYMLSIDLMCFALFGSHRRINNGTSTTDFCGGPTLLLLWQLETIPCTQWRSRVDILTMHEPANQWDIKIAP